VIVMANATAKMMNVAKMKKKMNLITNVVVMNKNNPILD